jgi:hypothetical protein
MSEMPRHGLIAGLIAACSCNCGKAVPSSFALGAAEVGTEAGIFAQEGLDISIASFRGEAQLQQALAAGSLDIGLGSGPGLGFRVRTSPSPVPAADCPIVPCPGPAPCPVTRTDRNLPSADPWPGHVPVAAHGLHRLRNHRCRRPAELAGATGAGEPDRGAMAVSREQRRALRLLAAAPKGATEAIMLAHGFTIEMLDVLVRDGHPATSSAPYPGEG